MRFVVVVESRAASDISEYAGWIVAQGSPVNASRWIDGIEEAMQSLAGMPRSFPVASESTEVGREIRQLIFKSHRVLFVVEGRSVHVLHVRHGARDAFSKTDLDR